MEDQDKLFGQFRASAENAEQKGFDRMEALWNRVEDKLDREKQRKTAVGWKYTGMAAMLALFVTVGTFLYRNENGSGIKTQGTENSVTVIDTQKVKSTFTPARETTVEAVAANPDSKNGLPLAPAQPKAEYDTLAPGKLFYRALPTAQSSAKEGIAQASGKYYETESHPANAATADAAPGTIAFSGTVVDSQGLPIPGVTISDGSGRNVQTDFDGKYTIEINEGDKLTASYIGMKNGSILAYKANSNRKTILADTAPAMGEVAVNSYRADAKAKSAVALRAITSEEVENPNAGAGYIPSVNGTVAEIDAGKVRNREKEFKDAGKNASANGYATALAANKKPENDDAEFVQKPAGQAPVSGIAAEARSEAIQANSITKDASLVVSEPLYIIDGIPSDIDGLEKVNSDDVVSITVLKDVSATSIYGSRGANGVIIIKTKKTLTKRELRKHDRELKKARKETAEKLKAAKP